MTDGLRLALAAFALAFIGVWMNSGSVVLGVVAGLAVILGSYVLAAAYWPLAPCRWCKGDGKVRSWLNRRRWRLCWFCKGHGDRIRYGRRVWDRLRTNRAKARKAS